jgi:aminopeptidase
MVDQRMEKLANLIVNYSTAVKPGDKVWIRGEAGGAPLMMEMYKQVLKAGGLPFITPELDEMKPVLLKYGSSEQVTYMPAAVKNLFETSDVMIVIRAEQNTHALSGASPQAMVQWSKGRAETQGIYMDRAAKGELRWALTLFPTQAYAQDADMSLEEYADFVYGACMPDASDPVGYWRGVSARQEKIIAWLKGKKAVHVIGKGTDLRLSIAGRPFINCDCKLNIPDGEIFCGPVEDSAEGYVTYTYPAIYNSREVTGVHLEFEKGRVVKASAQKNEDFLLKTLDTDEGSRGLGEFAIGTNEGIQKFTGQILFDEKIGGSFHMALGAGYPESGSHARSAIHWDMICDLRDGGQIWVDDQLLYENGKFVIKG